MIEIEKLKAPTSESDIMAHWEFTDKVYMSSVCITYNQELYIRDTLDGMLAQVTKYRFEIIVHDDLSTDSTRDILLNYKARFPSVVRLILQEKNQYSLGKRILPIVVEYTVGDYIAVCEGDDFWVDPFKLQKQFLKMTSDDAISLVHTDCLDLNVMKKTFTQSPVPRKRNTTQQLMGANGIRTLTVMFRRSDFNVFLMENKSQFGTWKLLDWPLWLYLSLKGEIFKINDVTAVYRVQEESASNFLNKNDRISFIKNTYLIRLYIVKKYKVKGVDKTLSDRAIRDYVNNGVALSFNSLKSASYRWKTLWWLNKIIPIGMIKKLFVSLRLRLG